jgi:hypothetical protein
MRWSGSVSDLPEWIVAIAGSWEERQVVVLSVRCPFCAAEVGELCRRGNPFGLAAPNGSKHGPRWVEAALAEDVDVPPEVVSNSRRELSVSIDAYEGRGNTWQPVAGARITPA